MLFIQSWSNTISIPTYQNNLPHNSFVSKLQQTLFDYDYFLIYIKLLQITATDSQIINVSYV